ncbi:proteasome assembly chaperone family protein [Kineosporia sp. R_H_3]|uniref:proteasome assembly chaperone family protein n=1 Tax=Kineosporia sp. R_H_3 TaxID=1961848 RepID=UPI000B4A7424|nr:PAC2 family protein [Kineosporia sp. R_H_3]
MLDPQGLFELDPDQPSAEELGTPLLVHAMSGFIDAGHAGRLAAAHLRDGLPNRVVARFDLDQLYDYRARRPVMTFVENRWEDYEEPTLELLLVQDTKGTPFLLLTGPEPDVQWERFTAAVAALVERYRVRATVGVHAIPMAVPHTRPVGVTAHATRPELVEGFPPWVGRVQVPGNVGGLLEFRLGQAGRDAVGYAVHVPHYLAQTEYPEAAKALVQHVGTLGGLDLPTAALDAAAADVRAAVESQIEDQPEVRAVVAALEEQYDAFVAGRGRSLLADETAALPTADELGAELERFLAEENERRGRGDD